MFERSFLSFEIEVLEKYGFKGREILLEFRNKEILDTINSMSDEELEVFYQIIEINLSETEKILNCCAEIDFLPSEKRFEYDSFYHTCYKELDKINRENGFNEPTEVKKLSFKYNKIIKALRTNIKSASDIKGVFTTTYQIKDELKLTEAQKIYQFKKYIENYLKKLVRDYGFDVEVVITTNDLLMLVDYILNGLGCEDILSKLSFVNGEEDLLKALKNYEDEFKKILVKLAFDKNNNFAILTNKFEREELDIYLFVIEGLEKTKKVNETNLIDSIFNFNNPSLQKKNPNLIGE